MAGPSIDTSAAARPVDPDLDLSVRPVVLCFAPVLLALFVLLLSLSDRSVFIGFEEGEPGTWLSLTLMFVCLLLVLPAIRNPTLDPARRKIAAVLSVVIGASMLDERLQLHEQIGWFIQGKVDMSTFPSAIYADDAIVLLLALVGGVILLRAIEAVPDRRRYVAHVAAVIILAWMHGALDLLAHRHYVWNLFWPDLTFEQARPHLETLGYFEETAKIWCEYLVIIFLLYFFHRQKGYLVWTIAVLLGSWLATAGLWKIDGGEGIPYVVMGGTLGFIRNYPKLVLLAVIWLAWTATAWRLFPKDGERLGFAGLFFLFPLVQSPVWWQLVFGVALALWLGTDHARRSGRRVWLALAVGQIVIFTAAVGLSGSRYLPNHIFRPAETVLFDTGYKPLQ